MLPSLRARVLLWLLLPLAAFVFVTGRMSHEAARQTADLLQDHALLSSARTIMRDVCRIDGALTSIIRPAAFEIFESPYKDQVFYKVVVNGDRLLGGNPDLEGPPGSARVPVFYHTSLGGSRIRAVAYEREVYDSGNAERVTVIVGKTEAS
ncbi:sensor histidine kinase N-terminal domain-containing protein, partial [Paraburkholderia phosphatilytica]|uniref:sensor histidine kinase N-terminal domain-containing protein n=1 Tax=Paraburkholderia phosphatilytica TaxID=2282883 RepID=UPI00197CDCF2